MITRAQLSPSSYTSPAQLSEDKVHGRPPRAKMHVSFPHGKSTRTVVVELTRDDLLTVIANAADALRLLDREASRG